MNGRGLAAADVDNDGRMEIAVNSIGGKLLLLRPTGPVGHWLDVKLSRFAPGAVVTATLAGRPDALAGGSGRQQLPLVRGPARPLRPRLRDARRASDRPLSVGRRERSARRRADRIVEVARAAAPALRGPRRRPRTASPACTPAPRGRSIATVWDETAVAALRAGARDPSRSRRATSSTSPPAMSRRLAPARRASARDAAISYAAYRVLLWQRVLRLEPRPRRSAC